MIRFAVLGYGFMGAGHVATLKKNPNAKVVAVIESNPEKLRSVTEGNIERSGADNLLEGVHLYPSLAEMLGKEKVDCLVVSLPTYQHRESTVQALQAGLHVVCEKPMALTLEDCDAMIEAAGKHNRQLFIAQCIRFWPEYEALKRVMESGELGQPISFLFRRVSAPPFWAGPQSWFADPAKSGGCVFDLHVHDVDFVHYLLGRPHSVFSQGIFSSSGSNQAVMTQYSFESGVLCCAEGSWIYPAGFKMAYTAVFEKGKLEYDSNLSPSLMLTRSGAAAAEPVPVPPGDGYEHEFAYFIECLETGKAPDKILPQSARQSIEIALAEVRSMREKRVERL